MLPSDWQTFFLLNQAGGTQTNSATAQSIPPGAARTPGIGGLGSFGNLPEVERMLSGVQDSSVLNQVVQNPDMMQMMQSLLSNPQYMNQVG